jgi:hypothetical protein
MTLRPADSSHSSGGGATPLAGILGDLSRLLWEQRELVQLLEYRLEVQQLVTIAGRVERLPIAVSDVESVLERIRMSEDVRLGVVAECSVLLGLGIGASLRQLIAATPEPWSYVLDDHQTVLLQLVASTEELASTNRELASKGVAESRRAFDMVGDAPVTAYGRHGDRPGLALPPTLVDRTA